MSEQPLTETDRIVRAEIGTRSPDGLYAVVRYHTADGRMFRRTRTRVRAEADVLAYSPGQHPAHPGGDQ